MPVTPGPILLAFNKLDQVDSEALATAKEEFPNAIFVSAQDRIGLETLRKQLLELASYALCQ
jgi:GTP-binding protein HflX